MPRRTLETLARDPSVPPAGVVITAGDPGVFAGFTGMLDSFEPVFGVAVP
jgi:hypothetical protein